MTTQYACKHRQEDSARRQRFGAVQQSFGRKQAELGAQVEALQAQAAQHRSSMATMQQVHARCPCTSSDFHAQAYNLLLDETYITDAFTIPSYPIELLFIAQQLLLLDVCTSRYVHISSMNTM